MNEILITMRCCDAAYPVGVTEPYFSWKVENCNDKKQIAYQLKIYSDDGQNGDLNCVELVWDSGKVISSDSTYIKPDSIKLKDNARYLWCVTVFTEKTRIESDISYFITGAVNLDDIIWISAEKGMNSPFIYKSFELNHVSEYATVNICGLGFFELYLNGKKVSGDFMNPVRTDYDSVVYKNLAYPYTKETKKRIYYLTYEVSKYLNRGRNHVVVWLGNGWYKQHGRITEGIFDYGDELKMFFQLINGNEKIMSDDTWRYSKSPIVYDNIFYGEVYDARINEDLLCRHRYNKNDNFVRAVLAPSGKLEPQICPPERIINSYIPICVKNNVYDVGQCISGFAEIECSGNAGEKVEIFYSEELNDDKTLNFLSTVGYVESDKNQIQKDVYILKGDGDEVYAPRFVWHAFRYFEIVASKGVVIKGIRAHYVCTDIKPRAHFESSSSMLNSMHKICVNTQLSNIHGCVPMDCPHRERLGYTGDGQISSMSIMYNFDAHQFYRKWIGDIVDAQDIDSGFVPHTAPFNGGGGGPAWGSAIAVLPWNMYLLYGDRDILINCKNNIKKWILYLSAKKENNLITHEEVGSWCLGDWIMPSNYPWNEPHFDDIKIPAELVNTSYYIRCINIYIKILNVLGEKPDNWLLDEKMMSISAINETFLNDYYGSGEQGCDVFPLYLEIVPAEIEEKVFEHIIRNIVNKGFCFDTGMLGTDALFKVLDKNGRNDIALKMLLNTKYPSYGYFLKNGATSLWETWEGGGSKNHMGLSSFDAWLFYGLAGIKPDDKLGGYKKFTLKPFIPEELAYLDVRFECEYGTILLAWKRSCDEIIVEIGIPFNTVADVNLNDYCFELEAGFYKYRIKNNRIYNESNCMVKDTNAKGKDIGMVP